LGLFATKRFDRGDYITQYGGIQTNQAQLDGIYDYIGTDGVLIEPTAPYAISGNEIVDAACMRAAGSFANDPEGSGHRANARMLHNTTFLQATTTIRPGEEIFMSYGNLYWRFVGPMFINFTTKYIRPGKA
jgi:hypothetical protein